MKGVEVAGGDGEVLGIGGVAAETFLGDEAGASADHSLGDDGGPAFAVGGHEEEIVGTVEFAELVVFDEGKNAKVGKVPCGGVDGATPDEGEADAGEGDGEFAKKGEAFFVVEPANEEKVEGVVGAVPLLAEGFTFGGGDEVVDGLVDACRGHEEPGGINAGLGGEPVAYGFANEGEGGSAPEEVAGLGEDVGLLEAAEGSPAQRDDGYMLGDDEGFSLAEGFAHDEHGEAGGEAVGIDGVVSGNEVANGFAMPRPDEGGIDLEAVFEKVEGGDAKVAGGDEVGAGGRIGGDPGDVVAFGSPAIAKGLGCEFDAAHVGRLVVRGEEEVHAGGYFTTEPAMDLDRARAKTWSPCRVELRK